MTVLAILALFIWLGLALARGGFWRADQRLGHPPAPGVWPAIAVIIPARDEAASISEVVRAHMASTYPGELEVFLVDDGSSDGTAQIARKAAASGSRTLHVIEAPPLSPGWSGKLAALNAGVIAADGRMPQAEFVLFTDADIVHAPDLAGRLAARAVEKKLALVSVMSTLDSRGLWGSLLIPAFVFFFQKLYPFALTNDPGSRVAGAAGGVVLLRRDVLEDIGGVASIRGALIDDCALADRVKNTGRRRPIELVLSEGEARSLRDNRSFGSIRNMVARTAYTQLDHSPAKLAGAVLGMILVYLIPPLAVLLWPLHGEGAAAAAGLLAWLLMAALYAPTLKAYAKPPWHAFALPAAAALYTGFTIDSAIRHMRGKGGAWKGRTYPSA